MRKYNASRIILAQRDQSKISLKKLKTALAIFMTQKYTGNGNQLTTWGSDRGGEAAVNAAAIKLLKEIFQKIAFDFSDFGPGHWAFYYISSVTNKKAIKISHLSLCSEQ